ncbi:MAG: amidohydrolase/deacetylase family metallohydrolase [Candidatus Latescibacteria bacterium]|nr:amidohydrolase/deacetylase family metallohydrolase [Candidatus Latescibacterota bacterium]
MKKIKSAYFAFLLCAYAISTVSAQEMKYDVLLKGGHVIDPVNNINKVMDVAVKDSKIALVDTNIPESDSEKVFDVSGYYVTPGLIDIHVHCFHTSQTSNFPIIADHHHFPSGVTTVVDAGTSGARNFEDFKKIIDSSRIRILAFLNIAAPGMGSAEIEPSEFDIKLAVETSQKFPEIIVGFKTAHYYSLSSKRPYDEAHPPWASADSILAAGRLADLPIMFDFHPRPPSDGYPARSFREIMLEKLRPGDIYTHCFSGVFPTILKDGNVNPDVISARRRGVNFDIGHGGASLSFKTAIPAIKQGFYPSSISTDLHNGNVNGPVHNMVNVMSKFLCIGMPLNDVIRCTTVNPAHEINHPELGNLSAGSTADIAVLETVRGNFSYYDCSYLGSGNAKINGDKKLQCVMTLRNGNVVWDPLGLNVPLLEDIPEGDKYWARPPQDW